MPADQAFDAARHLRAIRRVRTLSQRELAAAAGVPVSTISAIEAGSRVPGLVVFARILAAVGCELQVVDHAAGSESGLGSATLRPDDEHDGIRDRSGRRFPAHLRWAGKPDDTIGPYWWGWHRIAWYDSNDPAVPDHVYWHRPRPRPNRLGREPREHPFWN